jgi:capsular polysaccharide biosynthesis protein
MQLDFQQILEGLKKRWWLALIVTITAAAVAYIASDMQPRVYQAQVTVAAKSVPPDNGMIEAIKKTLPTYSQEMGSQTLVREVIDGKYGEPIQDVDPAAIVVRTQARPDDNSIVMTVDYSNGLKATQIAEGVSNAFIELETARNQQANASGQRVQWVVTQPAFEPAEPYQPRPRLYGAAAGLFGLVLGLLLAIGLELLDTTLKSAPDVQRYVGVNTVGVIPRGKA